MVFLFLRKPEKISKTFISLDRTLKLAYFYLQIQPPRVTSSGGPPKNRRIKNLKHRKTVKNVSLMGYNLGKIIRHQKYQC